MAQAQGEGFQGAVPVGRLGAARQETLAEKIEPMFPVVRLAALAVAQPLAQQFDIPTLTAQPFRRVDQSALLHKINPDTKKINKIVLEMDKIKKGSRAVELDKEVYITSCFLLAPYIGTENPEIGNTIPFPEFRQV